MLTKELPGTVEAPAFFTEAFEDAERVYWRRYHRGKASTRWPLGGYCIYLTEADALAAPVPSGVTVISVGPIGTLDRALDVASSLGAPALILRDGQGIELKRWPVH